MKLESASQFSPLELELETQEQSTGKQGVVLEFKMDKLPSIDRPFYRFVFEILTLSRLGGFAYFS